ncbi:hypothetical protein DN051_01580 [Streptomyces cadmiisoli]|uniref:Uncharacterized protein n=1 Tax=Streptomyces cadmiisoli TaxID=2184053 RepID=A0A2Z4ISK6_9ACTN|nr:hypothetical protein DN051_01580 [Streptomyces cadmiisoli]
MIALFSAGQRAQGPELATVSVLTAVSPAVASMAHTPFRLHTPMCLLYGLPYWLIMALRPKRR